MSDTKVCTVCGIEFPHTHEFFDKAGRGKLRSCCKQCRHIRTGVRTGPKRLPAPEGFRTCTICHVSKPETHEHFYQLGPGKFHSACKLCRANLRKERNQKSEVRAKHAAEMRDYRKAKPDVIARAEAKRDKEKRRADAARLRDSNRPRYRAYSHEYRSRAFQAEGTHTAAEIEAQIKHQKCKCYYCGASLKKEYHVDHVRPLTRGGRNSIDNLVLACAHCNLTKSDRLPHEWPEGGRLL